MRLLTVCAHGEGRSRNFGPLYLAIKLKSCVLSRLNSISWPSTIADGRVQTQQRMAACSLCQSNKLALHFLQHVITPVERDTNTSQPLTNTNTTSRCQGLSWNPSLSPARDCQDNFSIRQHFRCDFFCATYNSQVIINIPQVTRDSCNLIESARFQAEFK